MYVNSLQNDKLVKVHRPYLIGNDDWQPRHFSLIRRSTRNFFHPFCL